MVYVLRSTPNYIVHTIQIHVSNHEKWPSNTHIAWSYMEQQLQTNNQVKVLKIHKGREGVIAYKWTSHPSNIRTCTPIGLQPIHLKSFELD